MRDSFSPDLPGKLLKYHELLLEWNAKMDLTAVTEEADMIDRHYVDSLMALTIPELIPQGASLIDVGTGAGFPGLPLALARADLRVTLMDAQQKRLNFLQAVLDALNVQNVTLVHARAEDGARMKEQRECYDVAVARAVAPLPVLAEYLLPYVKVGGKAVCWKGPAVQDELGAGKGGVSAGRKAGRTDSSRHSGAGMAASASADCQADKNRTTVSAKSRHAG
ncbi:MAG: 16S rRNA (guanine(527)-N(7))-methyltransferase RsmG [Christensenellales bacterium]